MITSLSKYRDLALRTLAPEVAVDSFKATMNGALGISSEVGELMELLNTSTGWDEQRHDHMIKECGDFLWYWALLTWAFGLEPASILGQDDATLLQIVENEDIDIDRLVVTVGAVNEEIKKRSFHGHAQKDIAGLLLNLFNAWLCLLAAYGLEVSEVMQANIDKLMKRYPDGFSTERSANRAADDL